MGVPRTGGLKGRAGSVSQIRITGARIAPLGDSSDVLEGMDIWISGGRLAAIATPDAVPSLSGGYETNAFLIGLVLPGLVHSHSHSASALLRGTAPGAPLDLYVMEAMSRRSRRTMQHVRVGVLIHAIEMLKHGITGVVDHFRGRPVPTVEAVSAVFPAYEGMGMLALVSPLFGRNGPLHSPPATHTPSPSGLPHHHNHVIA